MIVDVLSAGESFLSPFLGNRVGYYVILFAVVYIAKQAIDILRGHKNTLLAQKIIEEVRDDAMGWVLWYSLIVTENLSGNGAGFIMAVYTIVQLKEVIAPIA